MKRTVTMFILILLCGGLLFAGGQNEAAATGDDPVVLRCGLNNPDGHPLVEATKEFGEILKRRSNGRYEMEFYTGGQLGDKKTHMISLQTGTLDVWMIMGGFLSDYGIDILNVPMLPYLFDSIEHARAVWASDIGDEILASMQASKTRIVGLGMYQEASRNFFFTDRAVTSIADMEGLKIRAQTGSIYEKLLKSFGGSVVPVAFSELYTALQTGVVDGAEQPYSGYYAQKFNEVAPYFLLDGHETSPNYVIFSEMTWNTIPEEDQKLIKECFEESVANFNKISAEKDKEIIAELKASGVQFLQPDNLQEWKDAAKPLYAEFSPGYGGLIEKIQNFDY